MKPFEQWYGSLAPEYQLYVDKAMNGEEVNLNEMYAELIDNKASAFML